MKSLWIVTASLMFCSTVWKPEKVTSATRLPSPRAAISELRLKSAAWAAATRVPRPANGKVMLPERSRTKTTSTGWSA